MYYFGGDYNPEQWPDHVRAEDLRLMRQAGVNLATVGVFSWSRLEPRPGEYDFSWLDLVLDDLDSAQVGVALATPTASPPPWFTRMRPDAMPVNRDGTRLVHGSRDTYCVNSPSYRSAASNIAARLAERYARHPALRLWHVHNEYGTWCFCDHCAGAFREWLFDRYGSLKALNECWTSAFWSQEYHDWADVLPPRATQYLPNPAQCLDYRRFLSDSMLAAYCEQRELLRAANPEIPITTNFVLGGWVPVDHARWAREVDVVAIDHYPSGLADTAAQTAFAADTARGWAHAAGHPDDEWLLMEHAPGTITVVSAGLPVQRAKPPGMMQRIALSHIARGSRGALYFQWRASRGGAEQWHSALVPHSGPDSRIFREASALGARLQQLPSGKPGIAAEVAVWYDEQCWWAVQASHLPAPVDYAETVQRWHRALWRCGYSVDVIPPSADLSRYRVVVLPMVYTLDDAAVSRLREFAAGGGALVISYLTGTVDQHLRVVPGRLDDLWGVRVDEHLPGEATRLSTGEQVSGWTERCQVMGAIAEASYPAGSPALTLHRFGEGRVHYHSCPLADADLSRWLACACAAAGVQPVLPDLPDGVEVVRSRGALWLFNHTDSHHVMAGVSVPAGEVVVM